MQLVSVIAALVALAGLTEAGVTSLPITRTSIGLFFDDWQNAGHVQVSLLCYTSI